MTESEFAYLRELLHRQSGLALTSEKKYLIESRLSMVCRMRQLGSLSHLVRQLRTGDVELTRLVVEAMTTNETLFFRDGLPFRQFREVMIPALLKARSPERTIRIWCAAASSGQEPYSLAMVLDDMSAQLVGWRIEILATDISTEILDKARAGVYSQFEVQRGLPIAELMRHFKQEGDRWRISERLRAMVTFKPHNLVAPQGRLGVFDIVFCRNVLIYFDMATRAKVLQHLHESIRPDGYLALGTAETVIGVTDAFAADRDNRGIYRPASATVSPAAPRLPRAETVEARPARPLSPTLSVVAGRSAV
jgi:chemotaxis protein methyltransferase CheR